MPRENPCTTVMRRIMLLGGNVQLELDYLDKDIARINEEISVEKDNLQRLSTIYRKLQDRDIPLIDPGTTREEAIRSTKDKTIMLLKKINTMKSYLNLFTTSRNNLANSAMARDIAEQVGFLNDRVSRYANVDTSTLEESLGNIADMNQIMDTNQTALGDSLGSASTTTTGADEMLFRRFMEYESEDLKMLEKDRLVTADAVPIDSLNF